MAKKDPRVNIKPFTDEAPVIWSDNWVSNGHFLVQKSLVKFGDHLTSQDVLAVAFPKALTIKKMTDKEILNEVKPKKKPHVFTRSFWGSDLSAMYVDDEGNVAWIARDYADAFDLGILFGTNARSAFYNGPNIEAVTLVIMPVTVAPTWNEIAKCAARITPEEPAEDNVHEMPTR